MATGDIEVPVDPRAEWRQIFTDAYRFERDFFYDPNMHGVDWAAMRDALREAPGRCGDAVGRELRARRVHRRAERVAHLSRRRRRGDRRRQRIGRDAGRRLGAVERRLPGQAHRSRRSVGRRRAVAARRARRQRQGRRLRARRQRRAAQHEGRSVGELPGARRQDRRADGQQHAVGRPARARWSSSA